MTKYHDQKVVVRDTFGETETVYRFMRRCDRCAHHGKGQQGRPKHFGWCCLMHKEVSRRNVTCPLFVATDETLTEMWCETQARDGDRALRKITYKGRNFFVDHEGLCDLIGYDPDD